MKKLIQIVLLFSITPALSQSLLTDPSTGCQYTLPWNCEDCTVRWTGNCNDSLPNGEGVLTVYHDTTEIMNYVGYMKNGNFDGPGTYRDGMNKIDGYFKNNNPVNIDPTLYDYIEENQISVIDTSSINHSFYGIESLFYYAVKPEGHPTGVLVLLPSFYEQPDQVLSSNSILIKLALENDLLVIVPTININLCLKKPSLNFLNDVFADAMDRYKCSEKNFIIGGFSLGGMNALRYTELAYQNQSSTVIRPLAVFGVDPPTDLVLLYNKQLKQLAKDSTYAEAKLVLDGLHEDIGTLKANYDQFVEHSAYSYAENQGGNLKYLLEVPIRIYCDPDIDWWMENRNFSYYDINA
ncbi:MAG: hypothetical protein MK105_19405, partial [Crocinitomicaceae bacterium]|nr:hypothetical protein [Crocinitomicaceae bacterium]